MFVTPAVLASTPRKKKEKAKDVNTVSLTSKYTEKLTLCHELISGILTAFHSHIKVMTSVFPPSFRGCIIRGSHQFRLDRGENMVVLLSATECMGKYSSCSSYGCIFPLFSPSRIRRFWCVSRSTMVCMNVENVYTTSITFVLAVLLYIKCLFFK